MTARGARITRETRETIIDAELVIDGQGNVEIETGVGFLDHMITSAMVHGFFDLKLKAHGDLFVDDHHTVEDTGIVLGQAFRQALGDFSGIKRFGEATIPMDESLARVVVDLSRRPYLYYHVPLTTGKIGTYDTQLTEEFWRAFTIHCGANIHIDVLRGQNMHHMTEAVFKSAGRAFAQAVSLEPRRVGVISTKGVL
jgi:imidazoleglycerol-phosphate dehydratase